MVQIDTYNEQSYEVFTHFINYGTKMEGDCQYKQPPFYKIVWGRHMKNIKNLPKKTKEFFVIFGRVSRLLWNSSRFVFIKTMVISILSGISVPLTLIVWKYLIDDMGRSILTGDIKPVLTWLLLYFAINYIQSILLRIKDYYQNILASYLNKYTSKLILNKVKTTDLKYFDDSKIYDKIRKVNEESTGRSISLLGIITNFIQSFSSLIGTITVLAKLNIGVMILCILICIPTLFVSMKMAVTQYDIYTQRFEGLRFIAYLKDIVTAYENIKEMKIYHVHDFFCGHILKQYEQYIREDKKIRKGFCKKLSLTDLFEEVSILIFKIYVVIKVIVEKKTLGDFSLYINSIDNFRGSIMSILNTIASIFENGLYIQNLFEFLDMDTQEEVGAEKNFNPNFKTIEFRNVWFRYPNSESYVLRNISFKIKAKCCYSIVGLNGSGKTTIIKLLLKLYTPDKGSIYIDGINLNDINTEDYQKNLGAVFQDFVKYPLTAGENIGCGNVSEIGNADLIYKAAEKSGADEFINLLSHKYDTQLHREWSGGVELSLGQWQKIAISRIFMNDFAIVVLDEPTASLDPKAEYEIYQQFRNLMQDRTSILIAHRFSTVKLADKIFVLEGGSIIEEGTHAELMKNEGKYATLFNMQAEAYKDEET